MKYIFLFLLLLYPIDGSASVSGGNRGVRSSALGNAYVALSDDAWAPFHNPAGLGRVAQILGSSFFVPEQYGLKELRTVAIGGLLPLNFGTVGINLSQFGFELYKETGISIGFGRQIDWDIQGGITLHLNRFSIERYGSTNRLLVDIGLLGQPLSNLSIGFSAHNIFGSTIGSNNEKLPRLMRIGSAYSPTRFFTILFELEKDIKYPLSIKAGVEHKILDFLALRFGTSSNPDIFSGGLGIEYSLFTIGYAGNYHKELGWTHQLELAIQLNK